MSDSDESPRTDRIALITGANQGVGLQVAKELVADGLTVLVGSRNLKRGDLAAKEIGPGAIALQIDVTDQASITAAAEHIHEEFGCLDLLVNNAGISNTRKGNLSLEEYRKLSKASNASLDEVRAVWETNVFGVLAVYQAMLPLIRESSDGRIVNVSSGVGSLTTNADPSAPYHATFGPIYPASKAALNAITLAMMIELESTDIKINLVSPAFTTRTSTDTRAPSPSRTAPARSCALRCSDRTVRQAPSRDGRTKRFLGDPLRGIAPSLGCLLWAFQ
jgi:NAD(P)-dependent dehydrogenase (short-subunit alcohol dehydrogenase family)